MKSLKFQKEQIKKEIFLGKFLLLARNKSFNYWLFAEMSHKIDSKESKKTNSLVERVFINVYGKYSVASTGSSILIEKSEYGTNCNFGKNFYVREKFDATGSRKNAYKTNSAFLFSKACKTTHREENIIDKKPVKIYKRKKS